MEEKQKLSLKGQLDFRHLLLDLEEQVMYPRFGTDGVKDDSNGQLFAEKDSLALFEVMKPEQRA